MVISLSGGSTSADAYRLAGACGTTGRACTSGGVTNAACLPATRARTTGLRETLMDQLATAELHRIAGERDPDEAASKLDAELEGVTLDLALMGVGPTDTQRRCSRLPRAGGAHAAPSPPRPGSSPTCRA